MNIARRPPVSGTVLNFTSWQIMNISTTTTSVLNCLELHQLTEVMNISTTTTSVLNCLDLHQLTEVMNISTTTTSVLNCLELNQLADHEHQYDDHQCLQLS